MDFDIPQTLTFTTDSVPCGLSSSQSDNLVQFSALFDSPRANDEPLDATEFAKAQDLWMMRDFFNVQESFKEIAHDQNYFEIHYDDQDQPSSVSTGDFAEESGGRQTPLHTVVDRPTVIANTDRAAVLETKTLSISQVTAFEIEPMSPERPQLAMTQVTAFEVQPKVPQRPVLAMSQVTTLDLKFASQGTSTVITAFGLSHKTQRTPSLESPKAAASDFKPANASTTEVLMPHSLDRNRSEPDLAATLTLSSGTIEGCWSRTERMKGLLGSFDHPIVICDEIADKELKRKLVQHVDQPVVDMDRCEELQRNKQPYPRRTNGRMRSKPERKEVVQWVQYEQKILCELQYACHLQGVYWEQVRDLPDLATNARVQQHDTLVRGLVEIAQDKRAVLPIDVDELRKSYTELQQQIMPKVKNEGGQRLLKQLSQTLDVVYNRSDIAHVIRAQCKMHNDKKDRTYRPSKRQRRL